MARDIPLSVRQMVWERSEGVCEALIPRVCGFRASHVHHRKLRSQGGGHDVENLVHICGFCHDYIHRHAGWSYERGLLVRGWDTPVFPPKYYRGVFNGKREWML